MEIRDWTVEEGSVEEFKGLDKESWRGPDQRLRPWRVSDSTVCGSLIGSR